MDATPEATSTIVTIVMAFFVLSVLYAYTLYKAISRCSPVSRKLRPWEAWLVLIPYFNWFWNFYLALKVDASLRAEYSTRQILDLFKSTKELGLAYAAAMLIAQIPSIKTIGCVVLVACWAVYWWRLHKLSVRLA
ncbi:hypothetical protein [Desulfocurvus sp. DL9XJH121]